MVNLTAADGHSLGAYLAKPAGKPVGGIVVVQEIFGVNPHIKRVTDDYAAQGYLAIAPALYDRFKRDIELEYTGVDKLEAFGLMQLLTQEKALKDIAAAFMELKQTVEQVAVVGFCYGGLMAWLSATRGATVGMNPACVVAYYPGGIGKVAEEIPSCPVIVHIGSEDAHIGQEQIDALKQAHPEVPLYLYADAQHGFNCDAREEFNPAQARVARERTLAFVEEHLSGR